MVLGSAAALSIASATLALETLGAPNTLSTCGKACTSVSPLAASAPGGGLLIEFFFTTNDRKPIFEI